MVALPPIQRRFLPDTITIFNKLTASTQYAPTVLEFVHFNQSNSYTQRQTGTERVNAFRIIVSPHNTEAVGCKVAVPVEQWANLDAGQQEHGFYCLHPDMWLIRDTYQEFTAGLVPASIMTASEFKKRGLLLLKTKTADPTGLGETHNIQLVG